MWFFDKFFLSAQDQLANLKKQISEGKIIVNPFSNGKDPYAKQARVRQREAVDDLAVFIEEYTYLAQDTRTWLIRQVNENKIFAINQRHVVGVVNEMYGKNHLMALNVLGSIANQAPIDDFADDPFGTGLYDSAQQTALRKILHRMRQTPEASIKGLDILDHYIREKAPHENEGDLYDLLQSMGADGNSFDVKFSPELAERQLVVINSLIADKVISAEKFGWHIGEIGNRNSMFRGDIAQERGFKKVVISCLSMMLEMQDLTPETQGRFIDYIKDIGLNNANPEFALKVCIDLAEELALKLVHHDNRVAKQSLLWAIDDFARRVSSERYLAGTVERGGESHLNALFESVVDRPFVKSEAPELARRFFFAAEFMESYRQHYIPAVRRLNKLAQRAEDSSSLGVHPQL